MNVVLDQVERENTDGIVPDDLAGLRVERRPLLLIAAGCRVEQDLVKLRIGVAGAVGR